MTVAVSVWHAIASFEQSVHFADRLAGTTANVPYGNARRMVQHQNVVFRQCLLIGGWQFGYKKFSKCFHQGYLAETSTI